MPPYNAIRRYAPYALAAALPFAAHAQTAEMIGRSVQLRVNVGNTTSFKTEDVQGWKNNGTGFTATTSGSGSVPISINITTVTGISYHDFTYEVTVKAASPAVELLHQTGTVSMSGGTKAFTVNWDPTKNPGSSSVRVQVNGDNPDRFTFFVEGTVSTGKPVQGPPAPPSARQPSPRPQAAPAAAVLDNCHSGTGESMAHFSGLQGTVWVRPDAKPDGWFVAKLDTELCVEDHIRTDEDAVAYLSLADMSTFVLKPESEVVVVTPPERDSKIAVVAGNIWTNVKKMVKDGSMEIDMNQAVCGIKGTTFALNSSPQSSTVQVFEGTVEFRSKATGGAALVRAGESMTATSRGLSPIARFDVERETAAWRALGAPAAPPGGVPEQSRPLADVSGTWNVSFNGGSRTTLDLRQSGSTVTGTLRAPDNSRGGVTGTFDGTTLVLSRDTGLETIQRYRLTVTGDRFTGTFANEGKYPDSGAFDGVRTATAP